MAFADTDLEGGAGVRIRESISMSADQHGVAVVTRLLLWHKERPNLIPIV